jgi:hypothetical protein
VGRALAWQTAGDETRPQAPPSTFAAGQDTGRFTLAAPISGGRIVSTWKRLWRDYSLSIVVAALFIASFLLHAIFGWWQYSADQASHGGEATVWGWDGYVVYFGEWTFQNWQSEFLEVLVLIVATAYLIHKGSHESKDGEDEMKAMLTRIEQRLDGMERSQSEARPKADPPEGKGKRDKKQAA